jgi:hypothetical protein
LCQTPAPVLDTSTATRYARICWAIRFSTFSKLHAEKSEEDSDMSDPVKNPVRTRILILEEHPLLRHGIVDYLNSQPAQEALCDMRLIRRMSQ